MKRPSKLVRNLLLILAIVLVSVYGIVGAPASGSQLLANLRRNIRLGLDLRGGVSFVLSVQWQDALNARAADAAERIRKELGRASLSYASVQVAEARDPQEASRVQIRVNGVDAAAAARLRGLAAADFSDWTPASAPPGTFILQIKPAAVAALERDVVAQTRRVLERRINAYGLAESPVQSYGRRGNDLLIQLPDARDPARIRQTLERRSVLEWYAVSGGPYASQAEATADHGGFLPAGTRLLPQTDTAGRTFWFLLATPAKIRGSDLRDARVSSDAAGQAVTTFTLTQEAAARFEPYTAANIGRYAAIVLDQRILSVPVIENAIRDSGQIRGARSREEAEDLALSLRSGSLPAGVAVMHERTVEPSLGADSIRQGMRAGAVGLAAVVAFLLVYYRRSGLNATLALLLNAVLLLAALSYCDAVLTLPGIAGIILTIGMAVDSNVLIFERIREELRAGKTAPAALAAGFSKAFATLLDTHVTTVVSCGFLFWFGTPAVKGFAVTLVLGLITNLFTSVFVSRTAFDWELSRAGTAARLSI